MKTFKEFVVENPHLDEDIGRYLRNALGVIKYMSGLHTRPKPTPKGPVNLKNVGLKPQKTTPTKSAPKGPVNLGNVGKSKPKATTTTKPSTFKVGTPPKSTPTPKPTPKGGSLTPNPYVVGAQIAATDALSRKTSSVDTVDKAPKVPTKPSQVKKGETYYDYNTRVGKMARPAARKKVGPKKVGPTKSTTPKSTPTSKSTSNTSFDSAFASARKSGKSEFEWKGKKYNTKLKGE